MQNEQVQQIIRVASLRMFLIIDYLGIHQSFDYTDSLGNAGCVAHHFVLFMYTSGSTSSAIFFQSSVHSYFLLFDVQLIFISNGLMLP